MPPKIAMNTIQPITWLPQSPSPSPPPDGCGCGASSRYSGLRKSMSSLRGPSSPRRKSPAMIDTSSLQNVLRQPGHLRLAAPPRLLFRGPGQLPHLVLDPLLAGDRLEELDRPAALVGVAGRQR